MRMRDIHIDLRNEAQDRIDDGESPDNMVHFIDDKPRAGFVVGPDPR